MRLPSPQEEAHKAVEHTTACKRMQQLGYVSMCAPGDRPGCGLVNLHATTAPHTRAGHSPCALLAVPFTPSQGVCTPSPTNMAAMWVPHPFFQQQQAWTSMVSQPKPPPAIMMSCRRAWLWGEPLSQPQGCWRAAPAACCPPLPCPTLQCGQQ